MDGRSGWYFFRYAAELVVTDRAPKVLPWKAPVKEMIPCLPVTNRASFSAPSTASAPELLKNSQSSPSGVMERSFSAAAMVVSFR